MHCCCYSSTQSWKLFEPLEPHPLSLYYSLYSHLPSAVTAAIHCLIYFPSFIYLFLCSVFLPYLVVFLRYFSSFDEANLPSVNSEAFFRPGPHEFPTVHFTSQLAAPAAALVAAKADTVEGTNCCNPLGSERRPRRKGRRPHVPLGRLRSTETCNKSGLTRSGSGDAEQLIERRWPMVERWLWAEACLRWKYMKSQTFRTYINTRSLFIRKEHTTIQQMSSYARDMVELAIRHAKTYINTSPFGHLKSIDYDVVALLIVPHRVEWRCRNMIRFQHLPKNM